MSLRLITRAGEIMLLFEQDPSPKTSSEIQRLAGFKSPQAASIHLRGMVKAGLLVKLGLNPAVYVPPSKVPDGAEVKDRRKPRPLSAAQKKIERLLRLSAAKTVPEIAEALDWTHARASHVVKRLVAAGVLTRSEIDREFRSAKFTVSLSKDHHGTSIKKARSEGH